MGINKEHPFGGEELFATKNDWLKIKVDKDERFFYTERKGIDSVAIVLFNKDISSIGLIKEAKPPFNEREQETDMHFKTTALGGSLFDAGHTDEEWLAMSYNEQLAVATETAIKETREEVGYSVKPDSMKPLGRVVFDSMSNSYTWLFCAIVEEKDKCQRDPQSANEARAELIWTADEHFMTHELECGKALACMVRAGMLDV